MKDWEMQTLQLQAKDNTYSVLCFESNLNVEYNLY